MKFLQKSIKMLSLLLFLMVIIIVIAACSDDTGSTDVQTSDPDTDVNDETESVITTDGIVYEIPANIDFNGFDFRIITHDPSTYVWNYITLDIESPTGDTLDDALYERNLAVEELLGINIEPRYEGFDIFTKINNDVASGSNDYDASLVRYMEIKNMLYNGSLVDLMTIDTIDLSQFWWEQSSVENLSITNKLYMVDGYIGYGSMDDTWVMFFNKGLIENHMLDHPYDLVKNGKWTAEKVNEYMKVIALDIDGDGSYASSAAGDIMGLYTNTENFVGLTHSFGELLITKNSSDVPTLNIGTENFNNVAEKIHTFMQQPYVSLGSDQKTISVFGDDKVLFMTEILKYMRDFREMETDYGIVPLPKYDETSDTNKSYVALSCPMLVVMNNKTGDDLRRVGTICEVLSAEGYRTMRPAYFNTSIEGKFARDPQTVDMINLIVSNRTFDIGVVLEIGNMRNGLVNTLNSDTLAFSAFVGSSSEMYDAEIQKAIDLLND